jgi:predicted chitinase
MNNLLAQDLRDGMKFRGRGMKQLTARSNYAKYWVYRGWLDRNSFDDPWWDKKTLLSNGKRAPVIDDPQRISTIPFNCIDTGGWYWEEGKDKSLNHLIQESQSAGTDVIYAISKAINGVNPHTGKPNGLDDRIKSTQQVARVVLDGVE